MDLVDEPFYKFLPVRLLEACELGFRVSATGLSFRSLAEIVTVGLEEYFEFGWARLPLY
jgi:hypothetical protein